MIDYSVYLTGNPMDEEAPEKAYARAQMKESMTFDKFVKHIADHNGVFSRGTVQGVVLDMCECLVEMLLNGNKVQLGALGDAAQRQQGAAGRAGRLLDFAFVEGRGFAGGLHRGEHHGHQRDFHSRFGLCRPGEPGAVQPRS